MPADAQAPPPAPQAAAIARRPSRPSAHERNAEARAALQPLAPGQRPLWVTVAAIVATVMALGNLVLVAVGYEVTSQDPGPQAAIAGSLILGLAAIGLWQARYWAVLGFEALLGFTILQAFLSLLVASNVWAVLLAGTILVLGGVLFYKLIRAMARLQMPRRPHADDRR